MSQQQSTAAQDQDAGQSGAKAPAAPQWVNHDAFACFGIERMRGATIPGLSIPTAYTPAKDPTYKWPIDNLRDLVTFYRSGANAFCAMGHPGTGKTKGIQQFHAVLNLPLLSYSANPRTEAYHLIGRLVPNKDGGMSWVDGPVLMAARLGCSVLIDEYNVIDPAEMTGLNLLLEGRPITIAETGELLVPKPGFRVFVTCNPKDDKGLVAGRHAQDNANDERFEFSWFTYLQPEVEIELIADMFRQYKPGFDVMDMATKYVDVANRLRSNYAGTSDSHDALDRTISTRVLRRWVTKTMAAASGGLVDAPHHYGLERAWSLACSDEVRIAVHQIVELVIGGTYKSAKDFLHTPDAGATA